MSTQASSSFDLGRFCQAVEERDAETQAAMYAPDATVTIADRVTQPGAPRVLSGSGEIGAWIADVCGREMSHAVTHSVQDRDGAAFTEACRYADGTNVMCATVMTIDGGLIADQTVVQAWDET
jgi:SnoaL-like domain